MEPAAAWGPASYGFQPPDWSTVEKPVTPVWAPAPYSGLPVEIFSSCCSLPVPAYVPQSVVGQEQQHVPIPEMSSDPLGARLGQLAVGRPEVPSDELKIEEETHLKVDIDRMKNMYDA